MYTVGGGKKLGHIQMQALTRPKLEVMGRLMDCGREARCVEVDCKRQRRMLVMLRGGMADFYCTVMVWQRREG